jgi:hypothetical protein
MDSRSRNELGEGRAKVPSEFGFEESVTATATCLSKNARTALAEEISGVPVDKPLRPQLSKPAPYGQASSSKEKARQHGNKERAPTPPTREIFSDAAAFDSCHLPQQQGSEDRTSNVLPAEG